MQRCHPSMGEDFELFVNFILFNKKIHYFLCQAWVDVIFSVPLYTHHVEEHDHAEVNAHRCSCGRHLRVVPDERPAEGGEGADGDDAVYDNAKHGGNHHQNLQGHRVTQ